MEDNSINIPFSTRFINLWMGLWICIYGIPILIKYYYRDYDYNLFALGYIVWVINTIRIYYYNYSIVAPKVAWILSISVIVHLIISDVSRSIYHSLYVVNPFDAGLELKYFLFGSLHLLIILLFPIVIFVYTKLWLKPSLDNLED